MLLRTVSRRRTLTVFDFLVPSSIRRQSASNLQKSHPVAPQSNDAALLDQFKKQITPAHLRIPRSHTDAFNNTLVKIRQALEDDDVLALIQHWQYLKQKKLLHLLRSLYPISALLAKYFTPESDTQWDVSQRNIAEEIALHAASRHSTCALNACMLFNLKKGNPQAVIRLYTRFMELLGKNEVWDESQADEEKILPDTATLATDTKSASRRISHHPERVKILLAVVTAHAMQDSFGAALQACLDTAIRFHDRATKQFLANFANDPALKEKVGLYAERLPIACMVARPPSLSKHITNISAGPDTRPLEELYKAIIDGLSGPDAYLAADPSVISSSRSVALTEVGWTSFLVAFLKCQRLDLTSNIWSDMARVGVKPGVSMWTALFDAYDSMHAVDDAIAAWNMMLAQGIKPDSLSYRALISALFNGRKPEEAMKTFQTFRKESINDCPGPRALSVYNTVLHGLLSADRFHEADVLMQNMHANGPKPDIVSYNTFLTYHGRRLDFKALAALINRMASNKLNGDVTSFTILLSALLKAGREDAPEIVLNIMKKQGIQRNTVTLSTIIDHQMQQKSEKNLKAAMCFLDELEEDPSLKPNAVTYTSILVGLYRGQWLSVEKAEEWRKRIVKRMERHSVPFTLPTYHILIKACLRYPYPEGLQHALGYYHDMAKRKVSLEDTTWYIMLAGLLQRGEWVVAKEIMNEMLESGIQLGGPLRRLVGEIRKRTG